MIKWTIWGVISGLKIVKFSPKGHIFYKEKKFDLFKDFSAFEKVNLKLNTEDYGSL